MTGRGGRRARRLGVTLAAVALTTVLSAVLAGCGASEPEPDAPPPDSDPAQVDAVESPELGACRLLDKDDIAAAADATPTVPCGKRHTAQTYAVGELPDQLQDTDYDSQEMASFAYRTCGTMLREFLGADESLSMRTVLSWAWFRPSPEAWDQGARWYRCDVVGGGEQITELVSLPETAKGLLQGRPDDRWMVCARGNTVAGSVKLPCTEAHDWRAVTTIKLGEADDPYPGDRLSEVQSRDFCRKSVQAWLNYPVAFDFGYTWFGEVDWASGNRRAVCWARTGE
ncbi:hypothetical protein GCM10023340_23640 [Nocardioides marinquilinus]|uniref:Septum formation-related domain-containing protein n=1 Tax=Nocardioides marinquilinus TaxID=1210400 RepID=A0ABP9PMD9_9ACTN